MASIKSVSTTNRPLFGPVYSLQAFRIFSISSSLKGTTSVSPTFGDFNGFAGKSSSQPFSTHHEKNLFNRSICFPAVRGLYVVHELRKSRTSTTLNCLRNTKPCCLQYAFNRARMILYCFNVDAWMLFLASVWKASEALWTVIASPAVVIPSASISRALRCAACQSRNPRVCGSVRRSPWSSQSRWGIGTSKPHDYRVDTSSCDGARDSASRG